MIVILVACVVVAAASLLALPLRAVLFPAARIDQVAAVAVLADMVAGVASLLALGGMFLQHLLGRDGIAEDHLWVVGVCLAAQAVGMVVLRVVTKPHRVPRRIAPEWAVPTGETVPLTVLVYAVLPREGHAEVEVFDASGRLVVLRTLLDVELCRSYVGHRAVALTSPDGDQLVDLLDLGTCPDEPVNPSASPRRDTEKLGHAA